MASLKIVLPAEVDAINPIAGDLYLTATRAMRMTATLKEEVAQQLYIRFKFFLGEWFLDGSVGIPYFQTILGHKTPIDIVKQILKSVVTTCPGVTKLTAFSLTPFAGRRAHVDFACILTDGSTLKSSDYGPFVVGPGV